MTSAVALPPPGLGGLGGLQIPKPPPGVGSKVLGGAGKVVKGVAGGVVSVGGSVAVAVALDLLFPQSTAKSSLSELPSDFFDSGTGVEIQKENVGELPFEGGQVYGAIYRFKIRYDYWVNEEFQYEALSDEKKAQGKITGFEAYRRDFRTFVLNVTTETSVGTTGTLGIDYTFYPNQEYRNPRFEYLERFDGTNQEDDRSEGGDPPRIGKQPEITTRTGFVNLPSGFTPPPATWQPFGGASSSDFDGIDPIASVPGVGSGVLGGGATEFTGGIGDLVGGANNNTGAGTSSGSGTGSSAGTSSGSGTGSSAGTGTISAGGSGAGGSGGIVGGGVVGGGTTSTESETTSRGGTETGTGTETTETTPTDTETTQTTPTGTAVGNGAGSVGGTIPILYPDGTVEDVIHPTPKDLEEKDDRPFPEIGISEEPGSIIKPAPGEISKPDTATKPITTTPSPTPSEEPEKEKEKKPLITSLPFSKTDPCCDSNNRKLDKICKLLEVKIEGKVTSSACPNESPEGEEKGDKEYSFSGKGFKGIEDQIKAIESLINDVKMEVCESDSAVTIPDWWNLKVVNRPPTLSLLLGTKNKKGKITRADTVINIPHWNNSQPNNTAPIDSFSKGNRQGIYTLKDGSKIIVNCSTEDEAIRVLEQLEKFIEPAFRTDHKHVTFRSGKKIKAKTVFPKYGKYYKAGLNDSIISPTWSIRYER